ncbi:DNA-binding transcriptional regulator, AcrR family [Amycolatopsis arida]|uniref:DNA-binding transcriptional regulator, AcrR family n=1 Tax=Amycolatopsis arida TaxID=587909 RepID=A0A1I5YDQ0_9PSEU|nr:TetR/AcrR family transcriptional regulator [Amycolatopsis arida]TDX90441.1 AcrR family transcriptional regulator [Amycolatopsis arida]SFQ42318.1 DNA-binding transcriptional regulator, AcrR family [Amycolatopsis arida]
MSSPRPRRPTAGKSPAILETFTRYVAERGYDGTNFGDIADELGISKGTIVHHYGTKDQLLAALHESYMHRRLNEARLIVRRLPSPAARLAGLLFAFMLYQVHDRAATVAFQREIARLARHQALAEGVKLRAEYFELVQSVLRDGIARGEFRECDPRLRSLLFFGSAHWAWTWFDPNGSDTAERVGANLVDMVLGGLLVDRSELPALTALDGPVLGTVRECLAATSTVVVDPAELTQPAG